MTSSVMFFSPYAGIWAHSMPEALVAGALGRNGAEVIYAVCDGVYADGCYVMSAYGVSGESDAAAREKICVLCRQQRDLLVKQLNVRTVVIDELLDEQNYAQIESISNDMTLENLETFQYEGFPLGRYAIHETIIHYKLTSLDEATAEARNHFRLKLRHVLITYFLGKKLLEKFLPDRLVTYNTHISTHYALMNLAESRGMPTFGLHAGGNMSNRLATLYVFRKDLTSLYKHWIARFIDVWSSQPTPEEGLVNATRHFLALTTGRAAWAYSAAKRANYFDVRTYFKIQPDQKILLATLSSYDELYSSQLMGVIGTYPLIFPTQVEWIRNIIAFAKKRKDLFLLIRVHPRELPNKRDSVHSKHAKMLAAELQELPDNVCVNWPSDGISLYDLIPQVDVGLNGWSSAGKELAMFGIPVVIYTKDILYYPHSLNILGTDRENYFECIERALTEKWTFDRVRLVYRWLAIEYTLGTISIKDRFNRPEGTRTLWRRVLNRMDRIVQRFEASKLPSSLKEEKKFAKVILDDASVIDLQLATMPLLSDEAETQILCREMGRILDKVYLDMPIGFSKTIDSLREIVRRGR